KRLRGVMKRPPVKRSNTIQIATRTTIMPIRRRSSSSARIVPAMPRGAPSSVAGTVRAWIGASGAVCSLILWPCARKGGGRRIAPPAWIPLVAGRRLGGRNVLAERVLGEPARIDDGGQIV